jgi:hypothetical protein
MQPPLNYSQYFTPKRKEDIWERAKYATVKSSSNENKYIRKRPFLMNTAKERWTKPLPTGKQREK